MRATPTMILRMTADSRSTGNTPGCWNNFSLPSRSWKTSEACWERVRKLDIDWPDAFLQGLISTQEQLESVRTARREQRELNGVEAQIAVVNAGSQFWSEALAWGRARRLLTPMETGILEVAARVPTRTPTDKQSSRAIEILGKLNREGYSGELPIPSEQPK